MTGLDCNILVQLALADHPANTRTRSAVDVEFKKNENLVFPPLVATEFLHVVTDARRFSPPLEIKEAIEWLEDFLAHPLVNLIQPNEDSLRQTMEWMKQHNLGRKRILDTHLAAVLHCNGAPRLMTSNPADFSLFPGLQVFTP